MHDLTKLNGLSLDNTMAIHTQHEHKYISLTSYGNDIHRGRCHQLDVRRELELYNILCDSNNVTLAEDFHTQS